MTDSEIKYFWDWFKENSIKLYSDNFDQSILAKLDQTISNWKLGWEIGPDKIKENSLTISAEGDKPGLNKAKKIISQAPKLDSWEFYFEKQPKENWNRLIFGIDKIKIDASGWSYILYQYPDKKTEILLKANSLPDLGGELKLLAVEIILINLLGERLYTEKIDFIEIVENFEDGHEGTELKYLPKHITDERYLK